MQLSQVNVLVLNFGLKWITYFSRSKQSIEYLLLYVVLHREL